MRGILESRVYAMDEGRALVLRLLQEIQALCRARNMFLHVVLLDALGNRQQSPVDEMAVLLSTARIEHSHLPFQVFPSTPLWLDGHLSRDGHRLLATHVLDVLRGEESLR